MFRQRKSLASVLKSAFGSRRTRKNDAPKQPKSQLRLENLESREVPATFTVNSVLDNGAAGTLRWAIDQANANPGYDTIDFGFTTSGVHTIQPLTPLPWITDAVKIDGYSQAGARPNTLAVGNDAVLNIEIDGSLSGGSGLILWGDGNTVQGLVVNNFPGLGIFLYYSDNNVIAGNFVGTDPSGTLSRPNDWGIKILAARNNVIGGADPADRNLVSGNKYDGINLQGTYNPTDFQCVGNQVVNNYAGTNAAGTAELPNGSATSDGIGISVSGGSGNLVAGNLISGNDDGGMILGDFNSTVQGNKIGTDATGAYGIPNTGYLYFSGYGNGINVYGDNNLIGGDQPGEGNLIAFNDGAGIYVTIHNASYSLTSAAIRGNSIHSNGGLGIDIGPEGTNTRGPNGNDAGDIDDGPNSYQNFPLLAAASSSGGGTVVTGTLNSTANTNFTLDFYASPATDSSGYGEGQMYLGSAPVTTDGNGDVTFNASVAGIAPVGWFLSATATGPRGTSEFSQTAVVARGGWVVNTNDSGPGSLRQAILDSNASAGVFDTITFAIPESDPGLNASRNAFVIQLVSGLPAITDPVIIDGYTQAGSSANTLADGDDAVLRIELDGHGLGTGLFIAAGNSTVRGLAIYDFSNSAIQLGYPDANNSPGSNVVEGNFLGTDASGTVRLGNTWGVFVSNSSHNRIGTNADGVADPAERNLIVGNSFGVDIRSEGPSLAVGNVVAGNFFGTDRTGTITDPDGIAGNGDELGNGYGIRVIASPYNTIGGAAPAARNIVSGGIYAGIELNGTGHPGNDLAQGNVVEGNYIGTDVTGTQPLGNGNFGLQVAAEFSIVKNNVISATLHGDGLVLHGGVATYAGVGSSIVQGNYIGTDVTGTRNLGNAGPLAFFTGNGISVINSNNNLIGGSSPDARNIISANTGYGIVFNSSDFGRGLGITGNTTFDNMVQGNSIGVDSAGAPLGNLAWGVAIVNSSGNVIGGAAAGAGNIIANNAGGGVVIGSSGEAMGTRNAIRGNSIYANGALGIDLNGDGVSVNDAADPDLGANASQNFPLLAAASSSGGGTVVTGTLNSRESTGFTLDFYASPAADPSGYGEGKLYLGSAPVTTDGNGDATFNATVAGVAPVGWFLTATATGPEGTSEFSGKTTVVAGNTSPSNLVLNGGSIFENDVFRLAGSFADADANDTHTVTVNWGDGTSPEVFSLPVGARSFAFDHRYLDDNPTATGADDYHPSATVSDGSLEASADATVRVTNIAPSNLQWSLTDHDIAENGTSTINVTFDDPGTRDSHRVTVDWGDGAVETYTVAYTERHFSHTHTYRDDNPTVTPRDSYVVGVSLVDDDGGVATSKIYGLKSNNGGTVGRSAAPTRLYSFNSDGTAFVDHGTVKIGSTNIDADALAYSPALGLFGYQMIHATSGAAATSSALLAINPTTAAATPIGAALSGRVIRGATFDAADRLWVIDITQNQLLRIDPGTGLIVGAPVGLTLGGNPYVLNDTTDIAVRNDGTFFVNDKSPGTSFYTLDPATGALTLVATDNAPGPDGSALGTAGLAFSGHRADEFFTYEHNGTDDIFRYDLANGFARSTLFANIIPSSSGGFNSGRGDLAAAVGNARVFVNNLDPVIDVVNATSAFGTGVVHVSGWYHDVGSLDTHTLTINWGHGSPETVTVTGGVFHLTHQYPTSSIEPGNQYSISATLTDDDTGTATKTVPFATSSISGTVFHDTDGDGVRESGEDALGGWIVYVDGNNNGSRDSGEAYTTTDSNGGYALGELPAGTQRVRLERPAGWTGTGSPNVNVGSGDTVTGTSLGAYRNAIIRGTAYDDENGNGRRDSGEFPLAGWTVFLDRDRDGRLDPGEARTVTDANGEYAFDGIVAGRYRVRIVVPDGWDNTSANPVMVTVRERQSSQAFTANFGSTPLPASLSGFVWNDSNNNGDIDRNEEAIAGAVLELTGVDDRGRTVSRSTRTASNGHYEFDDLRPGTYSIHELQPNGYADGKDEVGNLGGVLFDDLVTGINVDAGDCGRGYNFGERGGVALHRGQTATIGFWQNKNGQALIKSLNGGANATALGNWLASNFPNLYGAGTGANNLTGKTNAQVAAYYLTLFNVRGQKLEAQVLATAFAVYVTNSGLAGTTAAAYGFEVTATGTGAAMFNVGCNGSAFGVANNTRMNVMDILRATNARSSGGVLYGGSTSLRNAANSAYDDINNLGDIGC